MIYTKYIQLASVATLFCFFGQLSDAGGQSIDSLRRPADSKLIPVLWQQHSAEYRALCYQAFNLATERIKDAKVKRKHRYAIITDIDETVLDNSPYEAQRIMNGEEFNQQSWKAWTDKAIADPLPGAIEFFRFVASRKIEVFYISNRQTNEVAKTVENLRRLNFPFADSAHCIFMDKTSSKEDRRLFVSKNYNVIMLLGDNLNDFTSAFEKKPNDERNQEADRVRKEWGNKFIVLPNATYGEWENALYNYERKLTREQKEILLLKQLNTK
jgi:5'-nucleotidase (lipoprotein e(P4) family)